MTLSNKSKTVEIESSLGGHLLLAGNKYEGTVVIYIYAHEVLFNSGLTGLDQNMPRFPSAIIILLLLPIPDALLPFLSLDQISPDYFSPRKISETSISVTSRSRFKILT